MKFMLDTNICIYIIKNKPIKVLKKFNNIEPKSVCISSITASELWTGVYKSMNFETNAIALEEFLSPLRSELEKKGNIFGSMDLLISAHASSEELTLVTNNVKGFKRVKGLSIENWA